MVSPALASGQDIHFSQTTRSEFQLNPAFTGAFTGNLRATVNWKDQWQSINKTFRTYSSSFEYSFGKGRAQNPTFFALGLYAYKDVAGDVEVGNTNVGFSFSTLVKIDRNSRFIGGVQGSYGMTGLNVSKMQWGSQYNGINFDPSLTNGEGTEFQSYNYADVALGVAYWYSKNDKNVIHQAPADAKVGVAVYHLNKPHYTFDPKGISKLPMRFVIHASALFGTQQENLYWYPNFNLVFQGKQHEVYFGSLWKYNLKSASKTTGFMSEVSLAGGVNMRVTNVIDAIVPQLIVGAYNCSIGLSYDINISKLNAASAYRGGFEFSLRFTNPDAYIHRNPFRNSPSI
ncbi:MAG: PorP/SprF family type IX secretion system membrane protein [Bacteroidetes bacterium]|nr:PorP/SprF family type IX secretion system membrane protein [Bacteroidota bacterium]